MYLRILKKDIKRKKTMNIILFIFVVLATTFITSSVNNLFTISTALDTYLEKAELKDYEIIAWDDEKNNGRIKSVLEENEYVDCYYVDKLLYVTDENLRINGEAFDMESSVVFASVDMKQQKCFDADNNVIEKIAENEIYVQHLEMERLKLKEGDEIKVTIGERVWNLKVAGEFKDAFLGSALMGMDRYILNDDVFNEMCEGKDGTNTICNIYSLELNDLEGFEAEFFKQDLSVVFSCGKSMIKTSYFMDMLMAAILIVVSICLIIISMIILKFTIGFTLNEEYREIGIMKAIGIKMRKIRSLYIVKYFAMALIGGTVGFVAGVPFGNMLIKQVAENIYIETESVNLMLNVIITLLIMCVIVLFSYLCTRKVNKFSAIDAIRNGQNGERYAKKGVLRLSGVRLRPVIFMALNDILSSVRSYCILIIIFILGTLLTIVPVNIINTISDPGMLQMMNILPSDIYLTKETVTQSYIEKRDRKYIEDDLKKIKNRLADEGIEADVYIEILFKRKIMFEGKSYSSMAPYGVGDISIDDYNYLEGEVPAYDNEVAITTMVADKIGAGIGDTVTISVGGEEKEYIITSLYQSMNNMGEGIRLKECDDKDFENISGMFAIQIKYTDNPDEKEIEKRMELCRELFSDYTVETSKEYLDTMLGGMTGQFSKLKTFIVMVIILINALVMLLMEKTFIIREKSQIAMMKAIGFKTRSIIAWQVIRIAMVMIVSLIIGIVLSNPIGEMFMNMVYRMLGANEAEFIIEPFEVYVMYPAILLVFTLAVTFLTALGIRKISSQETNSIE